jgi:hypothetical protein
MTKIGCAEVKDLLPEWIRRELGEGDRAVVTAHVSSCASCSGEVELLERIWGAAFSTPASLASEIKSSVAVEMESGTGFEYSQAARFARWRLPAAATVVLALGTALVWQRTQALPAALWPSDDADVAGVPMLADLSDEDLALLLEELGG